jgi:hypothetical protein
MTSKRTLSVTVDGQTFTRFTDIDYTHVVCGKRGAATTFVSTWHKTEVAARKAAAKYAASPFNVGLTFTVNEVPRC